MKWQRHRRCLADSDRPSASHSGSAGRQRPGDRGAAWVLAGVLRRDPLTALPWSHCKYRAYTNKPCSSLDPAIPRSDRSGRQAVIEPAAATPLAAQPSMPFGNRSRSRFELYHECRMPAGYPGRYRGAPPHQRHFLACACLPPDCRTGRLDGSEALWPPRLPLLLGSQLRSCVGLPQTHANTVLFTKLNAGVFQCMAESD